MRVLKNNFNKISSIDCLATKQYPKNTVCEWCESELEYNKEDVEYKDLGCGGIICPCCGKFTFIDTEEITLTVDNIKFPTHFHHTSKETGAVEINAYEIKNDIKRGIEYFRNNKDEYHWYTEHGDLHLLIERLDGDEDYNIVVTKDYYSTYIPFESIDY